MSTSPSGRVDTAAGTRGRAAVVQSSSRPVLRASAVAAWAALLLVAGLATALTVLGQQRSTAHTVTVTTTTTPPLQLPSLDCALGVGYCSLQSVQPAVLRAVTGHFTGARLVDSFALVNQYRVYSQYVRLVTSTGVGVAVTAQCRGGVDVAARSSGPLPARGPARGILIAGGPDGCSVAVTVDVPAGVAVPAASLRRLSLDPAVSLTG